MMYLSAVDVDNDDIVVVVSVTGHAVWNAAVNDVIEVNVANELWCCCCCCCILPRLELTVVVLMVDGCADDQSMQKYSQGRSGGRLKLADW